MKYTVIGVKFPRGDANETGFAVHVIADNVTDAINMARVLVGAHSYDGASLMVAAVVYGHAEVVKLLS